MSDFETTATLGALADDEEPSPADPTPRSGRPDCPNCGVALAGRYCADCGQRDQPLRLPVHRFVVQSFTEFFGVDGRVWATLGVLLFKPGKLTAEYLGGRRRRYLRPLRVYLSSTLLFFVLLALLDPVGRVQEGLGVTGQDSTVVVAAHLAEVEAEIAGEPERVARQRALADSLRARADSLRAALSPEALAGVPLDSLGDAIAARVEAETEALDEAVEDAEDEADDLEGVRGSSAERLARWQLEAALLRALPPDSTVRLADVHAARAQIYPENNADLDGLPDWMARSEAVRRLDDARTDEDASQALVAFLRGAIENVPTVLFLILPVFALLLKVLYVRRGWFYSEHLVFGLHTDAFAFVVFSVVALLAVFAGGPGWSVVQSPDSYESNPGWLSNILLLTVPVYFLVAQKRVYGQGWIKTVLKSLVLGWVYFFVLIAGLVGVFLLEAAF